MSFRFFLLIYIDFLIVLIDKVIEGTFFFVWFLVLVVFYNRVKDVLYFVVVVIFR